MNNKRERTHLFHQRTFVIIVVTTMRIIELAHRVEISIIRHRGLLLFLPWHEVRWAFGLSRLGASATGYNIVKARSTHARTMAVAHVNKDKRGFKSALEHTEHEPVCALPPGRCRPA